MLSVKCSYSASQCINNNKKKIRVNKLHLLILFCNALNEKKSVLTVFFQ